MAIKKKSLKSYINANGFFIHATIDKNAKVPAQYETVVPEGATYFEGIVSDGELNRNGYIIDPQALIDAWPNFKLNPIILLSHDPEQPIGNGLFAELASGGKNGVRVGGYIFDDLTGGRFGRGLFKGLSTGHITEELSFVNVKTGEVLSEDEFRALRSDKGYFGEWENEWVMKVTKMDWVEYSAVTLPSNRKALVKVNAIEAHFASEGKFSEAKLLNFSKMTKKNETEEQVEEKTETETAQEEGKKEEESKETTQTESEDKTAETSGEKPESETTGETSGESKEAEKTEDNTVEKVKISASDREKLKQASDLLVKTLENTIVEEGESAEQKKEEEETSTSTKEKQENVIAPEIKVALTALVEQNLILEKEKAELEKKLASIPAKKALVMTTQFNSGTAKNKVPAGEAVLAWLKDSGFKV